jgi:hypothetical protein
MRLCLTKRLCWTTVSKRFVITSEARNLLFFIVKQARRVAEG